MAAKNSCTPPHTHFIQRASYRLPLFLDPPPPSLTLRHIFLAVFQPVRQNKTIPLWSNETNHCLISHYVISILGTLCVDTLTFLLNHCNLKRN